MHHSCRRVPMILVSAVCFMASLFTIGVMIAWFVTSKDCKLNVFFISSTLCLVLFTTLLSVNSKWATFINLQNPPTSQWWQVWLANYSGICSWFRCHLTGNIHHWSPFQILLSSFEGCGCRWRPSAILLWGVSLCICHWCYVLCHASSGMELPPHHSQVEHWHGVDRSVGEDCKWVAGSRCLCVVNGCPFGT